MLLTDGEDSVSDSVLQSASNEGIKIYTVGIGDDIDTNVLQHIANYTGGEFYIAKTAEDIVDIYNIIGLNQHIDMTDTDGDGIADIFETAGMRLSNGEIIYTDPLGWDTDGDGLKDGEEIVSQYKLFSGPSSGFLETPYTIYFSMKSNPNMIDSDGDGISDKDDRWNPNIWSENNPSDLRYKKLDPMQKNTLETLYPDINNYNNSNNANYITIEDNTIYITSRILFTGDAYSYFPNSNMTYAEVIEEGIESRWTRKLYGSDYDFVNGMEINVVTDVVPIDCSILGDNRKYITVEVNNAFGVPHTSYNKYLWFWVVHNLENPGNIYMYSGDSRGNNIVPYTYTEYQGTVAHEFGHTLCLGDAYFANSNGQQLSNNEEIYNGRFGISGSIMY